jgi:hypothetical protein
MKLVIILWIMISGAWAQVKPETFVVQINDRSLSVNAPANKKNTFSVVVENRSLSDQLGKFIVQGKLLKYISVKSGQTESVEIENKSTTNVFFVPVSPAFQEAELIFGKKAYEIPSKE